jgi:RHS repeat-associated protein
MQVGFIYDSGSDLAHFAGKFTGKERDSESGNDYFGARYYASTMGRFLSPDWSDEPDPVPYPDLDNPQSLNLYTYAGNNPLIHIDADGHCWPQWLCNLVIETKNKLFHGEFTTDTAGAKIRQLDREEERNRQEWQLEEQMKSHPPEIRYGVVFTPEMIPFLRQMGRPAFVPKNWVAEPLKGGKSEGIKYVDPNNRHNQVLLEKAKPGSSNPGQVDYMKVLKNGQWLDANGNPVSNQSLESHIPQGTELPLDTFGPIP